MIDNINYNLIFIKVAMQFTFSLNRNFDYGGIISPNKLFIMINGNPTITENNTKVIIINYCILFEGTLGVGENERKESILYRSESIEVPLTVLALLADADNQKNNN